MEVMQAEDFGQCPDDDKELNRNSELRPAFFGHVENCTGMHGWLKTAACRMRLDLELRGVAGNEERAADYCAAGR